MKSTMKDSAKIYFESYNLSSEQLNQLESVEREHVYQKSRTLKQKNWFFPVVALAAGVFMVMFYSQKNDESPSPDGIANEIAYFHNKTLSPEFVGNSIHEISPHFSKLDFQLVNSGNNEISDLKLVGGRYCSINKQLAAQLRLISSDSQTPITWYQLPLPVKQNKFPKRVEIYSNGIKVIMWTEKGVLHGLAGKP